MSSDECVQCGCPNTCAEGQLAALVAAVKEMADNVELDAQFNRRQGREENAVLLSVCVSYARAVLAGDPDKVWRRAMATAWDEGWESQTPDNPWREDEE